MMNCMTTKGRFDHLTTDEKVTLCGQQVEYVIRRADGSALSTTPDCRNCKVKSGALRSARR